MTEQNYWKKCSSCKKEIPFRGTYYACSVSTCRSVRTSLAFCSVSCWDAHLGYARHRDAYAEEEIAPGPEAAVQSEPDSVSNDKPEKEKTKPMTEPHKTVVQLKQTPADAIETDTLVVVSKVKQLIRDQSGFNTSQCCIDALTKKVVIECLRGIESAKSNGRKTVMGRDVE